MKEASARSLAQELEGEPLQFTDNNWYVILRRNDGRVVLISDVAVWEYADEQAFREGRVDQTIPIGDTKRLWR